VGGREVCLIKICLALILGGLLFSVKPSLAVSQSLRIEEIQAYEESIKQEEIIKVAEEKARAQEALLLKAKSLEGKRGGSCVVFVKNFYGVTGSWGWARNVKVNSKTPQVGAVMVTNQSKYGHVQIVLTEPDHNKGIWVVDSIIGYKI
jgi:hypothetical protein